MKSPRIHFAVVLVLTLTMFGAYTMWYSMVSQKSNDVAALQDQITKANDTIDRINTARTTLAALAADEEKVRSYFVSNADIVSFINNLQAIGVTQKTKVAVLSVSPGTVAFNPALKLALTVDGSFDRVMRTAGAIEYAPYDIVVTKLSVQKYQNDWHADLDLVVGSVTATTTASTP